MPDRLYLIIFKWPTYKTINEQTFKEIENQTNDEASINHIEGRAGEYVNDFLAEARPITALFLAAFDVYSYAALVMKQVKFKNTTDNGLNTFFYQRLSLHNYVMKFCLI